MYLALKIKETESCQKIAREHPELPMDVLDYLYD